jgi:membrane protein involved in colicin uptake
VSASISNTIGYVSTQQSQSTEEMNTEVDLNSSVEINFRTDQVPLDRMAGPAQADRIRGNSLNPEAEAQAAAPTRATRTERTRTDEEARRAALDKRLAPRGTVATPESGGAADARKSADTARREAAKEAATDAPKDAPAGTRT